MQATRTCLVLWEKWQMMNCTQKIAKRNLFSEIREGFDALAVFQKVMKTPLLKEEMASTAKTSSPPPSQ